MTRRELAATFALTALCAGALLTAQRSQGPPAARIGTAVAPVEARPFGSDPGNGADSASASDARSDEALRPARDGESLGIDSTFSEAELEAFRRAALRLPPSDSIQVFAPEGVEFTLGTNFDSIDITECCQSGTLNPPDPELAVGPDHIVAVVNASLEIYDKNGVSQAGPTPFEVFFATLPGGCTAFPFDPNVLYDESADRFIVAADGNGTSYCVGVSQTGDPLGSYFLYDFPVDVGGAFFDYPHAGVGVEAIYVGANMFGGGDFGRVFAFEKSAMYAGLPAQSATAGLGNNATPQPMNVKGDFPTAGPHYILTARNGSSNPSQFALFSWDDPFGVGTPIDLGTLDTVATHGIPVGFPVSNPQQGGGTITGFNPRPLDFEYRDGSAWSTNGVSCNPGGGTVNCVQWLEVDLAAAAIAQAGVFAAPGSYRFLPDLAVNACGDMMVGYTRSSASSFPDVWAAGRKATDPAGVLQGEIQVKAGEVPFGSSGTDRWGDYTGMTADPDGSTFWYLGEYSEDNGDSRNWGTYIGALAFPDCGQIFADGFESGDTSAWTQTVP